jgi:glutathione synthase/RimK-type ligase-like ATP-grasp enzyme
VLGHDQTTLIQRFQRSAYDRSLRAVVIGSESVAFDARPHDGWRPNATETYVAVSQVSSEVEELAKSVISRVGTGVYAILMIETEDGPIVTGAENLVTFRHLTEQGIDAAEMIVEFSLSLTPVAGHR